jgi:WD40 repeat protein
MQVLKSQHRLEGHKLGVFSVDVDASGTRAVSSSVDSQIKVWDLEKGELVKDIDPGAGRLMRNFVFAQRRSSCCPSPFLSLSDPDIVNTWCVAISHEAHLVAAGSNTGDVRCLAERRAGFWQSQSYRGSSVCGRCAASF